MSGIAAAIRTDGVPVDPGLIQAMTAAIAYRGPDGIAHWRSGPAALGHCLMRTTEESFEERQPLVNEEGNLVLVMDGYLANWEELRRELRERGVRLRDRSDAELVLRAYEQWGEDCPRHIDGEYAFLIWDARRREVFCARDHDGLRPLVYRLEGNLLLVASDIAAIVAAMSRPPDLNLGYLAEIVANEWYTSDETVRSGIMRLEPAHSMRVADGRLAQREYWTLPLEVTIAYKRDEDYFAHYRHVLDESVRRASRSRLPLAFEVSGGLDSSALFCVADRLLAQGELPAPGIDGYTLAGPSGDGSDEVAYADAVGRHLGRAIRKVPLFCPELEWFEQRARADCDFPVYPNTTMFVGLNDAAAADGHRCIIAGHGGDIWLNGSAAYYREQLATGDWRGLIASVSDDCRALGLGRTGKLLFRQGLVPLLPRVLRRLGRKLLPKSAPHELDANYWLAAPMRDELQQRRTRYWQMLEQAPFHLRYKLSRLKDPFNVLCNEMVSRQSAHSGLEYRCPMLSRGFMEFSARTPERIRLRGGVKKFTHREALRGILPRELVERRTKAYFNDTFIRYDARIKERCCGIGAAQADLLLDRGGVQRMLERYCETFVDQGAIWEIWGIYVGTALTLSEQS